MVIVGMGFLLGLVLGSFIDCLAARSLTNRSFWGRSYCESCKKTLSWYDLFPVLSYFSTKGKCRYCKKKIGIEALTSEVITGILFALLFWLFIPENFYSLDGFIIVVLLIVLITDLKKGLIPNRITYPAVVIALIYLVLSTLGKIGLLYYSLNQSPLGKYLLPPHSDYFYRHALITAEPLTYGLLGALTLGAFFGFLIIVTRGRGMGGGDFKLAILMGLILGFTNSILAVLLAFIMGSVVGLFLIAVGKKKMGQTIPFGPFLSIAGIIALFWGTQILDWYLNLKIFI
jgi:prepilin signal peptidase PulO-like enzyme (type II secretory pathway)